MTHLDHLIPHPDHQEHHHIDLDCDQQTAYQAARHLDFNSSKLIRRLFALRRLDFDSLTIDAMTSDGSFAIIHENPPHEYVIGHGQRFDADADADADSGSSSGSSSNSFENTTVGHGLAIGWNFATEPLGDDRTRLSTETRVSCYGTVTRWLFKPYWLIVRPFSGIVRKEMLKAAAEAVADDQAAGRR